MASKNSSASTSRPSVLGLFFGRGPRAVPWLVVAVVIDALDALTLWALSHVGKKGVKRLPSFADNNSTGSVAKELVMVRIRGSLNHVLPATIRSRWNSSWAMAVNKESFLYRFFLKTPAGLGVSSSQAFVFDYHSITTCAKAHAVRRCPPLSLLGGASSSTLSLPNSFPMMQILGNMTLLSQCCVLVAGVRRQPALAAILFYHF
jgi:hypothetical protein